MPCMSHASKTIRLQAEPWRDDFLFTESVAQLRLAIQNSLPLTHSLLVLREKNQSKRLHYRHVSWLDLQADACQASAGVDPGLPA